jgi:hypothetical protein
MRGPPLKPLRAIRPRIAKVAASRSENWQIESSHSTSQATLHTITNRTEGKFKIHRRTSELYSKRPSLACHTSSICSRTCTSGSASAVQGCPIFRSFSPWLDTLPSGRGEQFSETLVKRTTDAVGGFGHLGMGRRSGTLDIFSHRSCLIVK